MSASKKVTKPVGSVRTSLARASSSPRIRTFCSWPVMKPTGTIPYFFAAFRSLVRARSEEHTSELQSRQYLVCRLLLEKKKNKNIKEIRKYTHQTTTLIYSQ